MKPVLYVDVDGVLADSMAWWLTLYNIKNCTSFQKEQVTCWETQECLGTSLNEYFSDYRGVSEVPGAKNSVFRLSLKYEVILTTAGSGKDWAIAHGFNYPVFHVPLKMKKHLRGFALIDDYEKNLDGFDGLQFLMDQPWNRNSGRVGMNWEQITEELLDYAKNGFTAGVQWTPV